MFIIRYFTNEAMRISRVRIQNRVEHDAFIGWNIEEFAMPKHEAISVLSIESTDMPQTSLKEVIAKNRLDSGPHFADAEQVNTVDVEPSGPKFDSTLGCHKLSCLSRSHC